MGKAMYDEKTLWYTCACVQEYNQLAIMTVVNNKIHKLPIKFEVYTSHEWIYDTIILMIYSNDYVPTNLNQSSAISLFFYTYCTTVHHLYIQQANYILWQPAERNYSCTQVIPNDCGKWVQSHRKKDTEAQCSERWRNCTAHCTLRKLEISGAYGLIVRPRSIYIAPLTATSTNGHTTVVIKWFCSIIGWKNHSAWVLSWWREFSGQPHNRVLTAHAEWLSGVQLRHSVPPMQYICREICDSWWLL